MGSEPIIIPLLSQPLTAYRQYLINILLLEYLLRLIPPQAQAMTSGESPMGPHALEQRLRQLEAIHRSLGEQIAALRLLQEQYGLGIFYGTIDPPAPYGKETKTGTKAPPPFSLSAPAAQPDLTTDLPVASQSPKPSATPAVRAKKSRPKRPEGPPTKDQFEAARSILMDGYTPDRPGDGDRLLKTIVYRLLLGSSKGFKSAELDSARTVARHFIEQAGLRSGPGFRDGKLRSLLKKYVPFDPIISIRRLPR